MMMFSLTSTASESDIRATMQAGYNGIGGSVEANMSAKQQAILSESKIKITSIGGDAEATLAMIRSGDWSQYFTNNAPLSSASPMSYTFRNLGDGSIASVSETTEYNIRTCEATQSTPGTFSFLSSQELSLPIPAPVKVMMGDVDGDGNQDLIYNHVSASSNETVIALSNGDGTFAMGTPVSHSDMPANGWSQYVVKVGDFNNDGRDDLAWGRVLTTNTTYISLSNGNGTFDEMPKFTRASAAWGTSYSFEVGNIDGKDGDDLIWNTISNTNRTYVTLSNGDGTFGVNNTEEIIGTWHDHPNTGWNSTDFRFYIADFDGNGRDDLVWHTVGISGASGHGVWFAESKRDEQGNMFDFRGRFLRGTSGWQDYRVVAGNIDGIAGSDMVWINTNRTNGIAIHRNLTTGGTPALRSGPLQFFNGADGDNDFSRKNMVSLMLDVNGDGRKDLLMNQMDSVNRSSIGLGLSNGEFDFSRISQDHPAGDQWGQFEILTGDIDGDSREDVVYVNADATNRTYVGVARP